MNAPERAGLQHIPSMTALLEAAATHDALRDKPRVIVTDALRRMVADARARLKSDATATISIDSLLQATAESLKDRRGRRLTRVINATGVLLHTGLGRSVLAPDAIKAIFEHATGYCNLEIDLATGRRGQRGEYAEELLCRLTGAESALIVNNNAAATMLVLHCFARGRETIVSRGQLVEIGGSFRLPEVMTAGGALLREVGTTNKTHLGDYEAAINEKTGLLMHVHTSNYRIVGFSESPGVKALTELAHRHRVLLFDDLGSGALIDDEQWFECDEPTVTSSLRDGADIVAFSGDKLLGGPQAGILLGRREPIERLRKDPMARALRIDKLRMAALEATLELYFSPENLKTAVPTLAGLAESKVPLQTRAEALAAKLRNSLPEDEFIVADDESFAGGGSLPACSLKTMVVRWMHKGPHSIDELARRLRTGECPVLARINENQIIFDLRTIGASETDELVQAVSNAASNS